MDFFAINMFLKRLHNELGRKKERISRIFKEKVNERV